eukprot:365791-Chlamydomonas_euryale.AAC.7
MDERSQEPSDVVCWAFAPRLQSPTWQSMLLSGGRPSGMCTHNADMHCLLQAKACAVLWLKNHNINGIILRA